MKSIVECFDDFRYIECFLSLSLELISLFIIVLCVLFLFQRGPLKCFSRKSIILLLILLSNTFYFIYHLHRRYPTFYFLEQLFGQLYETFLVYYFGRKITMFDKFYRYIILTITFLFLTLNFITFVISIVVSKHQRQMCKIETFSYLRGLSLLTQLVFTLIARSLYQKAQTILKDTYIVDPKYFDKKRKLDQLILLVYLSLFGYVLLFVVNFCYLLNSQGDCRIVKHVGDVGYNFSDTLNAIISDFVKLISYFVPFLLSLVIFRPEPQTQVSEGLLEAEPLERQDYFQGLSLKLTTVNS